MNSILTDTLNHASVVMMCGVSGSGKTFVASQLEAEGYERLSADKIVWDEYGDTYFKLSIADQHKIYIAAIDSVISAIPEKVNNGRRVVIDASMCKRQKRDFVRNLCSNIGAECITVYLSAPREILKERLNRRQGTGPDDQRVSEEELDRFLSNFEAPNPDENFIQI